MKAKVIITIATLIIFSQSDLFAQSTAYANIFANVVAPVGITKKMDLSAGQIITSANNNVSNNGAATVAAFQVSGKNITFAVTLPNQPVVLNNQNADQLTVSDFTSEMAMTASTTGTVQTVKVGASLSLTANQAAGNYSTGNPFNVTLNYN